MNNYDQILEAVRQKGERVTLQRRLVIEVLTANGSHMTIQNVCAEISKCHPSHALPDPAIYRIPHKLKDLGLISQTDIAASGTVIIT